MKALVIIFVICIIACLSCSKNSTPKTDKKAEDLITAIQTTGSESIIQTQKLIGAIEAVVNSHYLFDSISIRTKSITEIRLKSKIWANPNDAKSLMEKVADTIRFHPISGHTINFGLEGVQVGTVVFLGTIIFQGDKPILSNNYAIARVSYLKELRAAFEKAQTNQINYEKQLLYRRRVITPGEIEDFFLNDLKWDTKVRSWGEGYQNISIRYVLMSRVLANELSKSALMDKLRKDGYKRVVFTDGYDYEVSYSL